MKARLIATIIAALIAAPAVAHHSFAMFDTAREVELRRPHGQAMAVDEPAYLAVRRSGEWRQVYA